MFIYAVYIVWVSSSNLKWNCCEMVCEKWNCCEMACEKALSVRELIASELVKQRSLVTLNVTFTSWLTLRMSRKFVAMSHSSALNSKSPRPKSHLWVSESIAVWYLTAKSNISNVEFHRVDTSHGMICWPNLSFPGYHTMREVVLWWNSPLWTILYEGERHHELRGALPIMINTFASTNWTGQMAASCALRSLGLMLSLSSTNPSALSSSPALVFSTVALKIVSCSSPMLPLPLDDSDSMVDHFLTSNWLIKDFATRFIMCRKQRIWPSLPANSGSNAWSSSIILSLADALSHVTLNIYPMKCVSNDMYSTFHRLTLSVILNSVSTCTKAAARFAPVWDLIPHQADTPIDKFPHTCATSTTSKIIDSGAPFFWKWTHSTINARWLGDVHASVVKLRWPSYPCNGWVPMIAECKHWDMDLLVAL